MPRPGGVGAAIETDTGHIYTGVCIDTACSMGFCAEHAAAAAMLTAGENRIRRVIAVGAEGQVMPPCGRCPRIPYRIGGGKPSGSGYGGSRDGAVVGRASALGLEGVRTAQNLLRSGINKRRHLAEVQ